MKRTLGVLAALLTLGLVQSAGAASAATIQTTDASHSTLATDMARASEVVSLAMTTEGPQVYESGHVKGWTLEETLFLNVQTGEEAMGPVQQGLPQTSESTVTLSSSGISHEWIKQGAVWQPELVLFSSAHRESGAGMFMEFVPPWPTKPPALRRILRIKAQAR